MTEGWTDWSARGCELHCSSDVTLMYRLAQSLPLAREKDHPHARSKRCILRLHDGGREGGIRASGQAGGREGGSHAAPRLPFQQPGPSLVQRRPYLRGGGWAQVDPGRGRTAVPPSGTHPSRRECEEALAAACLWGGCGGSHGGRPGRRRPGYAYRKSRLAVRGRVFLRHHRLHTTSEARAELLGV